MPEPVEIPFCDLRAAHELRAAETEDALLRVARSGRYVLGDEVEAFELEVALLSGAAHAIGVGNGTDALALILRAAGIGPGDEAIVPAYTAPATWVAVCSAGASPIGVDVDARTGLIDPDAVRASIGPRTRAIVGVHLFGRLAPIAALREIGAARGALVIEDAAHAAGVDEGDGPAGSLGDAAAFSFYPTKPLGALGDGGAVVTSDAEIADSVRALRSYGWSDWHGQVDRPGINSRLDELQAAVLRPRIARVGRTHSRLRELAGGYRSALGGCTELELPDGGPSGETPWHQFVVRHPRRDELRSELARRGVGTAIHYAPLPPQLRAFGQRGRFPRAEALSERALSLPFDAWLTDAQAEGVTAAVASSLGSSM